MSDYRILCVDDEEVSLNRLVSLCKEIAVGDEICGFSDPQEALQFARGNRSDVAMLDVNMPGINGMSLSDKLMAINPEIHIIITTAYRDYAFEAYQRNCFGYLLKPIRRSDLQKQYDRLPRKAEPVQEKLTIRCFGDFEVYYKGQPMHFGLKKSKELLAYLVDRKGGMVEVQQILAALWEDDGDHSNYFKSIRKGLIEDLSVLPYDVLITGHGILGLNRDYLDCDYFNYLDDGSGSFDGEYMEQYPWNEFTKGALIDRQQ